MESTPSHTKKHSYRARCYIILQNIRFPPSFQISVKKTENGEKWGKGRKPSSKRKRNCKSYFRNVIVTLNSAWNGPYLQMYTARISSKRFFLCFLPAEFPRLT